MGVKRVGFRSAVTRIILRGGRFVLPFLLLIGVFKIVPATQAKPEPPAHA